MREDRPSATALRVAMRRAAHQLLDDPKVFDDPLALSVLGKKAESALRADPHRFDTTPLAPYLRAFVAARSRLAEDELALAVRRGVRQYVIVGGGLDTFAYRNPYPEGTLHVYELDHPTTQAWKRARLQEAGIALPADLTLVPHDFERGSLEEGLRDTGLDHGAPSFFSWLGVTEYLTADSVTASMRYMASRPQGGGVVFDYMVSPSLLSPAQRARFEALAHRVASAGEPWQTFFDPGLLTRDLQALGFGYVEDNGQEEINGRYFKDRRDSLRVGSLSRIMIARV
jgi:methyltransferase (TIGR00027 family)